MQHAHGGNEPGPDSGAEQRPKAGDVMADGLDAEVGERRQFLVEIPATSPCSTRRRRDGDEVRTTSRRHAVGAGTRRDTSDTGFDTMAPPRSV